jgi:23S rRNA pseudouridine1911/1915/1917 synthase
MSAPSLECERLDLALTREPFSFSRREARRILADHRVLIDGRPVSVSSRPVPSGARLTVVDAGIELPVIDLSSDYIVIDKPPSIPSQPAPTLDFPSLFEVAAAWLKMRGEDPSLHLVQRLDTNTSGVILFARGAAAAKRISEALASDRSTKLYSAIVSGAFGEERVINAPIGRASSTSFRVSADGRDARTEVRPLRSTDRHSLVEARLFTGRTHQIRVHLAHAGHPIVGDRKYGGSDEASRTMLHASFLSVRGCGEWTSPLPSDFVEVLNRLALR